MKERNEQGLRKGRDTTLTGQKVPLKTLEFISVLNARASWKTYRVFARSF